MSKDSSFVMPEGSHSLVPCVEAEVGHDLFAYYTREIEELFSQKEDRIPSLLSKPVTCAGTSANDKDSDIVEGDENPGPSFARKLFCNGVGDGLSGFMKERLKVSLKQSVTAFGQENDETLQSVLKLMTTKKKLYAKESVSKTPTPLNSESNQSPHKKQKMSSSPSSAGVAMQFGTPGTLSCEEASGSEGLDRKDPNVGSSEESQCSGFQRTCVDCKTTSTPQWRAGPDGRKNLCNACGIRRHKRKKLLPRGFDNKVDEWTEVAKSLRSLLELDDSIPDETLMKHAPDLVKSYSEELQEKMENAEKQLENYLNVIMSNCRKMTIEEKLKLRKLIQNLPSKNLARVVEIILQRKKLPEGHSRDVLHVDLGNEDDVTLWRLYYYVAAVERAKHLAAMDK